MKINFFLLLVLISFSVSGLEVDKKLNARILDLSSTKRTILLNKGKEDGLALKDQAKFSDSDGVFARGEVIKISPSRSAWSLFRLYRSESVSKDKAVIVKISEPFKTTPDPTKDLGRFSSVSSSKEKIKRHKSIINFFNKVEKKHISTDGVDYSILDNEKKNLPDPEIDWSALNDSEPAEIDPDIDYSSLQ